MAGGSTFVDVKFDKEQRQRGTSVLSSWILIVGRSNDLQHGYR